MPISIQTTVSISIIKLDDWVAGLHFIRECSGEKVKRKLFENISQIYFIRNKFSL